VYGSSCEKRTGRQTGEHSRSNAPQPATVPHVHHALSFPQVNVSLCPKFFRDFDFSLTQGSNFLPIFFLF
jgi:hypothetical protein